MSNSNIVKTDGTPVEMVPVIKWRNFKFPCRSVDEKVFKVADPRVSAAAVKVELSDQNNLLWVGLWALASDLYSRNKTGSHDFLEFADTMGLVLTDGDGNKIDVAKELADIIRKN